MRLLIGGSTSKFYKLTEFGNALQTIGHEYKLVEDIEYSKGFPSKNTSDWFGTKEKFKKLVSDFSPDAILIDRNSYFGLDAIKSKIPLFILLRGNYWLEKEISKKTINSGFTNRTAIWLRNRNIEKIFRGATMIFTISGYLEKVVKQHYPDIPTSKFFEGMNTTEWSNVKGMELKHPCVGLLQSANIWPKTKEILTMKKVLEHMPDTTFYWAGDGVYRDKILLELNKYKNFKSIGKLEYPQEVKEFLSAVDVYALPSGLDTMPLTLMEAQLLKRPVVATNVGGIPECLEENKTGFLIEEGDYKGWIDKLSILINDKTKAKKMGCEGREFVKNTFNWATTAKNFLSKTEPHIKNN